ncbi:MAG: branched-chain amino acid ABC transporter permease, partial [Armatimonadetes bacterium]|nr:branched-chain amino acid ABC transporter permease [Armatimonadota bacterium]
MAAPEHQTELSPSTAQLPPAQFWFRRLLSLIAVFGGIIAVQYWMVPNMPTSYDVRLIVLGLLFAVLAVSLNLINGITGQFSIGHAAFYLIGAYTTARLTLSFFHVQPFQDGVWLLLMMVVGGVAAGIAGFIVGLPSLRLRGDYLAIVTLGFGEIARIIVINQQGGASAFWGLDLGGAFGLIQIPRITTLGYVVLLLVFTVLVSRNLLKTSHGLTFLAVREDETAAEATGVNTTRTKVTAFVIGAALAGMAGALFAHFEGFIQPLHFDMTVSFIILTMVVIGGTGSITGAAVAGFSITLLQEGLRELGDIGAIDLIGYIIAAVLIIIALGVMRRRTSLLALPTVKKGLTVVGLLACVLTILAAYRLWGLDVS